MPQPPPLTIKSRNQIRDDMLRTRSNGLIARGVANPNVGPGSDDYVLATAVANELAVVEANAAVAVDLQMPDTATGDNLRRWLQLFNTDFRPAGGSAGFVTLSSSASTTISQGQQLLDSAKQRFQVSQTGTYAANAIVPVSAVDVGASTNHASGDVLTWVVAPPFCDPTVTVGPNGLTGGIDQETDEPARARLLSLLQNPPASGNWQDVVTMALASTPMVQGCAVYPAAQGPGSLILAVWTYSTVLATSGAKSANRNVDTTTLNTIVVPYVQGLYPEHAAITGNTVTNVPCDVSIALTLPSSPAATPPGPGGGWVDGTPWPANTNSSATFKCTVMSVTSATVFTVDAPSAPTVNATHIAYLSPTDWTLRRAKVLAVTGSAGAYTITVDNPLTNIATGNFIFPDSQNAQTYVNALLTAFSLMGPGEVSSSVTVLSRGFRHPTPSLAWPYALGSQQLRAITDSGPEVLSAAWLYRAFTTPAVPGSVTTAPNILIPQNLGFYST